MQQAVSVKAEKPPRPETNRATLVSAGFPKPRITVHFYKETRLLVSKDHFGKEQREWGHYFECLKTGTVRLWGTERTAEDAEQELN